MLPAMVTITFSSGSGEDVGCGRADRRRVCGVDDDGLDTGLFGGDLLGQFGSRPPTITRLPAP